MTFTNLEKYVYSKTMLKTTTSTPLPIPPAKSKVFSSQKSHLATAVFCNWICLSSRQSNKTFRLSFILKGYFLQPRIRKTGYFKTAEFLNNCHKSLNIYNSTKLYIYWSYVTVLKEYPGNSISTNIDICINKIDFRIVSLTPRYTLCLLRSWRKETESLFCDAFFFKQDMGLP